MLLTKKIDDLEKIAKALNKLPTLDSLSKLLSSRIELPGGVPIKTETIGKDGKEIRGLTTQGTFYLSRESKRRYELTSKEPKPHGDSFTRYNDTFNTTSDWFVDEECKGVSAQLENGNKVIIRQI